MARGMKRWAASLAVMAAVMGGQAFAKGTDSLPVGRCVNMGNHLEMKPETRYGRAIADDDFQIIAAAGFQTVRIPANFAAYADAKAPYAIDPAFMTRVKHVVGLARAAGLNVILDSHNYDELNADPAANKDRLAGIWKQVGDAFKAEPRDHLWFEIANEPHDKLGNANLVDTFKPALAAIRAGNPDRPVIIGGEFWSGVSSLATLQLPDDPNVVPTFHYYEPFQFTHQGATWVGPNPPPLGRKYGLPEDETLLANDIAKVKAYIARTGKTPFVGESGAFETAPLAERVKYVKTMRTAFDAAGIGMCAWAFTNTFPLYDSKTRAWIPGMLDAMGLKGDPLPPEAAPKPKKRAPISYQQPTPALQALDDALPSALISDPSSINWPVFGQGVKSKVVAEPGVAGGAAMQVVVPFKGAHPYDAGMNVPITWPVETGHVLDVAFWARTLKADTADGRGVVTVRFQRNAAPYDGFGDIELTVGPEWKLYEVKGTSTMPLAKGEGVVGFQFAGARQTLQIGQTFVLDLGEN